MGPKKKHILTSKTFWGGVLMVVSAVFPDVVLDVDAAAIAEGIGLALGFITVVFGRVSANKEAVVNPSKVT